MQAQASDASQSIFAADCDHRQNRSITEGDNHWILAVLSGMEGSGPVLIVIDSLGSGHFKNLDHITQYLAEVHAYKGRSDPRDDALSFYYRFTRCRRVGCCRRILLSGLKHKLQIDRERPFWLPGLFYR